MTRSRSCGGSSWRSPKRRRERTSGRGSGRGGHRDLQRGAETAESLLVSIGAPRLARLGLDVSGAFDQPEHRLYELLAAEDSDSAHSRYNALIRRLVSFERAAECAS